MRRDISSHSKKVDKELNKMVRKSLIRKNRGGVKYEVD